MASSPITSWQIDGETVETGWLYFSGLQNHCGWWLQPQNEKTLAPWKKSYDRLQPQNEKTLAPWKKSYDQPRQHIKKQRHYLVNKDLSSQGYDFSSGHVWMWELDYKEGWVQKNWCFWTVVLEKTLEGLLDYKEIKPVHPKGNQSWIFIGRTDAEAETPILWPPNVKSWLIWKDPDAGKDWGQKEKGMTEDKLVGWHHWLNGHGFVWIPGVGDGQGGLVCCNSWVTKSQTWLTDWTELNWYKKMEIIPVE